MLCPLGTPLLGGAGRHGGGRRPLLGPGAPWPPSRPWPERRPLGGDGVEPGRRGLCGRREAGGGRAREGGRLARPGPASAPATPGTAGLFVWAAGRPHRALRNREGAAGSAGPGRAVLPGLRGRKALGPRRELLARTGLTGGQSSARAGPIAATATISGTQVPEGTKPAALDARDFCSWDLAAGIYGCTASEKS